MSLCLWCSFPKAESHLYFTWLTTTTFLAAYKAGRSKSSAADMWPVRTLWGNLYGWLSRELSKPGAVGPTCATCLRRQTHQVWRAHLNPWTRPCLSHLALDSQF
jgi:hypothetical protein